MKTKFKILLLLAVTASCLTACYTNKEIPGDILGYKPVFQETAGIFHFTGESDLPYRALELTESGLFFFYPKQNAESQEILTGDYDFAPEGYALEDFGTVRIIAAKVDGYRVIINTEGKEYDLPCTMTKGSVDDLFRTWTVEKTRILLETDSAPIGMDFEGCRLAQISQFLKDNGIRLQGDFNRTVLDITISAAGTLMVRFQDWSCEYATWDSFKGNKLTYSWNDGYNGFYIDNGMATIDYQDGRCIFTAEADIDGAASVKKVKIIFALKG